VPSNQIPGQIPMMTCVNFGVLQRVKIATYLVTMTARPPSEHCAHVGMVNFIAAFLCTSCGYNDPELRKCAVWHYVITLHQSASSSFLYIFAYCAKKRRKQETQLEGKLTHISRQVANNGSTVPSHLMHVIYDSTTNDTHEGLAAVSSQGLCECTSRAILTECNQCDKDSTMQQRLNMRASTQRVCAQACAPGCAGQGCQTEVGRSTERTPPCCMWQAVPARTQRVRAETVLTWISYTNK
jgi:hypothetical protein